MRDPERIEKTLDLVREIWVRNPDWRLTQLIMNGLSMHSDPYYIEDEFLYDSLTRLKDTFE